MSSSASLLIMVKDVQDTPPIFQRLPYMTTISEDTHVVMVQLISIPKLFITENMIKMLIITVDRFTLYHVLFLNYLLYCFRR